MDNIGPYLSYSELLQELVFGQSNRVVKSGLVLSNKLPDLSGDLFEFSISGTDPQPLVGDVVDQAGFGECIAEVLTSPDRIRVETENSNINNGPSFLLHSDSIPKHRGIEVIKRAMNIIDRDTGQFFNRRSGTFLLEGNNSIILHFPVPIIEIRKLLVNSTDLELIEGRDNDFEVFKGREVPQDDRMNPKIRVNIRTDNIFSGLRSTIKVFLKNTRTEIEGDFGFLEPDGSTPFEIKEATLIQAVQMIDAPSVQTATSVPTGSLKRIKVDLHEQEFFETRNKDQAFPINSNDRYSNIISKFRKPLMVSGSFREVRLDDE